VRHDPFLELRPGRVSLSAGTPPKQLERILNGLGDASTNTMDRAFEYADAMTAAGLRFWDPQTESMVGGEDHDATSATRKFAATSQVVREMADDDETADEAEPSEAPPRWKLWRR
jgi:hypothetical protein